MNLPFSHKGKPSIADNNDASALADQEALASFLIYENSNYLCDRPLTKEQISIGSSQFADVVLNSNSVADFHALVHFQQGQAFLTNNYPNDGLRLNGRTVKTAELRSKDIIQIGPYALHFNMAYEQLHSDPDEPSDPAEHAEHHGADQQNPDGFTDMENAPQFELLLVNRYENATSLKNAASRMATLFKADITKILPILKKDQFILKHHLSKDDAEKWRRLLKNAGILCIVRSEEDETFTLNLNEKTVPAPVSTPRMTAESTHVEEPQADTRTVSQQETWADNRIVAQAASDHEDQWPVVSYDEEEEDSEEDEWIAPFELAQNLTSDVRPVKSATRSELQLMVVKRVDGIVSDIQFLEKKQKYVDPTQKGAFRLAEHKSGDRAYVYFPVDYYGFLSKPGGSNTDLDFFKTDTYLHKRRKQIYRLDVPEAGALTIGFDNIQYYISLQRESFVPEVDVAEEPSTFTWRHWALSGGVHVFVLLCLLIYGYIQAVAPKPMNPQFVKIDPALMAQLNQKEIPKVQPKKKPPEPKPEPVKVAPAKTQPKPTKKAPKPRIANAKKQTRGKNVAAQVSRHPKAGGGFGKGNITNRNINQTGLLSVLGSSKVSGPTDVIASVTNLDAVEVPGATEKNFTVGGLKGSLGNGKIALATGAVVQTKGSNQVLRSAGARGKGEVAALERGSTGKKKIKAMVSATMSRTVKIEGGMSREMVKRVIDQHLEEITYCYESALINNPAIMGRIVYEWKILMSGRVGEIRIVASSVNSHEIHECIKSAIKSWQFPKPVGAEVVVSYPFIFDLVAF